MTKLKIVLLIVAVAISLAVTFVIHRSASAKMRENDTVLRQQDKQLAGLAAEHERLSNQVARAGSPSNSHLAELEGLRAQAQALQNQTSALAAQLRNNRQSGASRPASSPETHPPEYYEELFRGAGARPVDARNLSTAFASYALDHQGRFPSNLEDVASYLDKQERPLSGTNQFDIIYHGTLDDLKGIPRGSVAVIRVRQPWTTPSGKQARVYGLADGSSQIVESDDDFKAWEAEHIISTAPAGR